MQAVNIYNLYPHPPSIHSDSFRKNNSILAEITNLDIQDVIDRYQDYQIVVPIVSIV